MLTLTFSDVRLPDLAQTCCSRWSGRSLYGPVPSVRYAAYTALRWTMAVKSSGVSTLLTWSQPTTETTGVGFFSWYFRNQKSNVALTSREVKATPSCHLTPWRSFQVTSILAPPTLASPFSRVGTSVASSGTQ